MPTSDRRPRGSNRRNSTHRQQASGSEFLRQRFYTMISFVKQYTAHLVSRISLWSHWLSTREPLFRDLLPRKHAIGLLVLLPLWLVLLFWQPASMAPSTPPSGSLAISLISPIDEPVDGAMAESVQPSVIDDNSRWLQHDVQAGETLYAIFRKFELPGAELNRLIAIEGPDRPLTRLQTGRVIALLVDSNLRLQRVEIRAHNRVLYRYDRDGDGFLLGSVAS